MNTLLDREQRAEFVKKVLNRKQYARFNLKKAIVFVARHFGIRPITYSTFHRWHADALDTRLIERKAQAAMRPKVNDKKPKRRGVIWTQTPEPTKPKPNPLIHYVGRGRRGFCVGCGAIIRNCTVYDNDETLINTLCLHCYAPIKARHSIGVPPKSEYRGEDDPYWHNVVRSIEEV